MGAALYLVAEREVPGLDVFVNGKALGRSEELDRLAQAAGVRPLMEFFSIDPGEAAAFLEGEGAPLPEAGLPAEEWFPAEEGLATVRGMLGHLATHPRAVANAKAVAEDLREFEAVLARLASAGVRWHLAVDY